jgi:hypothetical protein
MAATAHAARAVMVGDGDVYVAGGVESMTRAPYVMSKASKPFGRDVELFDTTLGWRFVNPRLRDAHGVDSMGQTAENVAERLGISREDQDVYACRSQAKAAAARESGRFAQEIVRWRCPRGGRARCGWSTTSSCGPTARSRRWPSCARPSAATARGRSRRATARGSTTALRRCSSPPRRPVASSGSSRSRAS